MRTAENPARIHLLEAIPLSRTAHQVQALHGKVQSSTPSDRLLVELINEHGLASVSAVDARYAGTVGRGPWVAGIVISRIDKLGNTPG